MNVYKVWHERNGFIQVFAMDEKDAVEQYYLAIESMIGKKSFDKNSVLKVNKVEFVCTVSKVDDE